MIERDLERYLERIDKKIDFIKGKKCYDCILYKDELMGTLRRIKELKSLSKLETILFTKRFASWKMMKA